MGGGQKDRPGVRVAGVHMANAVRLLICAGKLMLFDRVAAVIINRGTADQACLRSPFHNLAIDIEARLLILRAYAVRHKLLKFSRAFSKTARVVKVDGRFEINLRFIHVQEGIRIPLR